MFLPSLYHRQKERQKLQSVDRKKRDSVKRDGKEYKPLSDFEPPKDRYIRFTEVGPLILRCDKCGREASASDEQGDFCDFSFDIADRCNGRFEIDGTEGE